MGEAKGYESAVPTNFVVLEVSDTGVGMSPEVRDRVFEPFFTTKNVGKGTGLGLSTAYGIVEQANGHITVESEPDQGTTFRVYFPRAAAAVPEKVATTNTSPAPGHETLLLAEDEEGIRAMTRVYLESLGYKVLEAPNGTEALRISREYEQPIDLLVTDIVMPGMRGDDLASVIQKERPGIAALFISGYADTDKLGVKIPIIEKPFTFPELGKRCVVPWTMTGAPSPINLFSYNSALACLESGQTMNASALAQWMIFSDLELRKIPEHNALQQGLSRQLGVPLADKFGSFTS